jgi:galactose mutarotase-like enzyme
MAKILETKLPIAIGEISPETFNRLVRVLELSLNKVDIDSTLSVNETQRNENQFQKGDIIWNLSTDQLQLWTGEQWVDIYTGTKNGVEGVASLGKISVSTNGSTTVSIL